MANLLHFSENELYLDDMQASKVLDFFGFSTIGTIITMRDREFAQALLVEAIDASRSMWYIQTLYDSASKPNSSVQSIMTAFAQKSLMRWFKSKVSAKRSKVVIYESVKNTIRWKANSIWRMRQVEDGMIW